MTRLLLDTMVTSELRRVRHRQADPTFAAWAASVDLAQAYVSVITIHEMLRGVLLTERRDPARGAVYRAWLNDLTDAFYGRVLDLTLHASTLAAEFHIPDSAPLADSFIAGTARAHNLTIATRNTTDFVRFDIPLINPWDPHHRD